MVFSISSSLDDISIKSGKKKSTSIKETCSCWYWGLRIYCYDFVSFWFFRNIVLIWLLLLIFSLLLLSIVFLFLRLFFFESYHIFFVLFNIHQLRRLWKFFCVFINFSSCILWVECVNCKESFIYWYYFRELSVFKND